MSKLLLALAFLGQGQAITPGLKDAASDKKFFASDYPRDTRPVVDKGILNKLKTDSEPYPVLQSADKYDKDFTKDENSDTGHWKAQFDYDALRKKVLAEEADEKKAADKAAKEKGDISGAQKKADAASEDAAAAKKDATREKAGEDAAKDGAKKSEADADAADPQAANKMTQKEMEQKVGKAEDQYEEQKKAFALCKQELEDAKTKYEELKVQMSAMESKNAGGVKLWVEQKDAKLKVSKSQMELAAAKREAAEKRLLAAESSKLDMEKALLKEKDESDMAQKNLAKEHAEKEQAKSDLKKATERLQKLRGYAPDAAAPAKSGALQAAAPMALVVAVFALF